LNLVAFAAQGDVQHLADGALVIANQNVTHALLLLPPPQRWCRVTTIAAGARDFLVQQPPPRLPQSDASAAQIYCPDPPWNGQRPCLRELERSGRRWPNPDRCRLRIAIGMAQTPSQSAAGSFPDRYRRN